ncbi:MAG: hypothetical protein AAFZ18_18180 [Myxococcota bacterium]
MTSACSPLVDFTPPPEERGGIRCANGVDDDRDTLVDCEDPDCLGHCPEASEAACTNRLDDDGDGWVDFEEPSCWVVARPEAERCVSFGGTPEPLRLSVGDGGTLVRGSWIEQDDAFVLTPPPLPPPGIEAWSYRYLAYDLDFVGGRTADVQLTGRLPPLQPGEGALLDLALLPASSVPREGLSPPGAFLPSPDDAVVVSARVEATASGTEMSLALRAGRAVPASADPTPVVSAGTFSLSLEGRAGRITARLEVGPGEPLVLLEAVPWPEAWPPDLELAVVAWAERPQPDPSDPTPAPIAVDSLTLSREPLDPCGYRVPQLPSENDVDGGRDAGRLVAAATTPELACALAVERLDLGGAPVMRLVAWSAPRPLERVGETLGALLPVNWDLSHAFPDEGVDPVRGAALLGAQGAFEGLVATHAGLELLRSSDCATWTRSSVELPLGRDEVPLGLVRGPDDARTAFLASAVPAPSGASVSVLRAQPNQAFERTVTRALPDLVPVLGPASRIDQILDGPDPWVLVAGDEEGSSWLVLADGAQVPRVARLRTGTPRSLATDRFGVREARWWSGPRSPGAPPLSFLSFRTVLRPEAQVLLRTDRTAVEQLRFTAFSLPP